MPVGISSCWQRSDPLCLHPKISLPGSRQCCVVDCWIADCWIAVLCQRPSLSCPGRGRDVGCFSGIVHWQARWEIGTEYPET